jgi:eukaryotic-like serine/threonine-protein kinase
VVENATFRPGYGFGSYRIEGLIGKGGMATVYRAKHVGLNKDVALKVMSAALLERGGGAARFLREAQAAAAVKHPNVVDITDVGVWEERPFLIMELLQGEDLQSYLNREGRLSEPDLAHIMLPVIAGLAAVHEAGIVHRDLKPGNIFLSRGPDGDVVPKILDFGISRRSSGIEDIDPASTPYGELLGTPLYMSPEAVRGNRDLTPRSDQYSLGIILYECVAGRLPFSQGAEDNLLALLGAIAAGEFPSPRLAEPSLSLVVEAAIVRATSRREEDRFPAVRELGQALWQVATPRTQMVWSPIFGTNQADRPLSQRPSAPPTLPPLAVMPQMSRGLRRRWLVAGALGLVATGAIVTLSRESEHGASDEPAALAVATGPRVAAAGEPGVSAVAALTPTPRPTPVGLPNLVLEPTDATIAVAPAPVAAADLAGHVDMALAEPPPSRVGKVRSGLAAKRHGSRATKRADVDAAKRQGVNPPGAATEPVEDDDSPIFNLNEPAPLNSAGNPPGVDVGANQSPIFD